MVSAELLISIILLKVPSDELLNVVPVYPLLYKLNATLMLGFHNIAIPNKKTYSELSIGLDNLGFGKFKLFRLDYVRSYQNNHQVDGVVLGIKILNVIE